MQQQDVRVSVRPAPQADLPLLDVGPASALSDWRGDLRRAVLSRVLPRLSDPGRNAPQPEVPAGPNDAEAEIFRDLALSADGAGLLARAEALLAGGLPIDDVVEGVMAGAARRLGDLWLADRASFFDVTAGLGHLQGLLRALGPRLEARGAAKARRILLAPAPGEQHVFGLSIVAAFFRRAGWDVTYEPRVAFDGLLDLVRAEPFAVVGLSLAGDRFLSALPGQVEALRRASLAPDVVLLAGGPAFEADPGLCRRIGVDAVARDAAEAVRVAEALSAQAAALRACS